MAKTIVHGAYSDQTRYDIVSHEYMAEDGDGGSCYVELLEIRDAPDLRCPFVIHEYISDQSDRGHLFTEWESLEVALAVFKKYWNLCCKPAEVFARLPGFLRYVRCGKRIPWFYATENQQAIDDMVALPGELF